MDRRGMLVHTLFLICSIWVQWQFDSTRGEVIVAMADLPW